MINPLQMTGKTVLVTGGGSGIGKATACLLSQLGARVVVAGREVAKLHIVVDALEGTGHKAVSVDLARCEGISTWMRQLANEIGPLDGVVHCAGVQKVAPIKIVSQAGIENMMRINLYAAIGLAQGLSRIHAIGVRI